MLLETYLLFITDLGNAVVVGALASVVAVCLFAAGNRRSAIAVLGAFLLSSLLIGLLKLAFMSCQEHAFNLALRSPSGHVAMSTAVYAMITAVVGVGMKRWQRGLVWFCVIVLLLVLAASRILLGLHSPNEVGVGLVVGVACFMAVHYAFRPHTASPLNGRALLLTLVVVVVALHGVSFSVEPIIQWLAEQIRPSVNVC